MNRVKVSRRFVEAVRLSPMKAYMLARLSGLHPSTLSLWLHGGRDLQLGDCRAVAIGRMVGLEPEECFETPLSEHRCPEPTPEGFHG